MRRDGFDVLVVDDETVIVLAAKKILEAGALAVDVAGDARTALDKLGCERYGVVLCDLKLPGVRGFELVRRMRECAPATPVVTITGFATLENAIEGFDNGVFDFIPKPFDFGELLGVVRRGLDYSGPGAGEQGADRDAHLLGGHAWVALRDNGRARIGMGETFACLTERIETVALPALGQVVPQGNRCVRLVTAREEVHRLWAPISGQVVATNERALGRLAGRAPGEICRDWWIEMLPSNPAPELALLECRTMRQGT